MTSATCTRYESSLPYTVMPATCGILFCSDGRLAAHIDRFADQGLRMAGFDRIAVPGGAACLAGHWATWREEEVLRRQLQFLIDAHQLGRIALIAHQDCGHYIQRLGLLGRAVVEQQFSDLRMATRCLRQLAPRLQVEAYHARHDVGRVSFQHVSV